MVEIMACTRRRNGAGSRLGASEAGPGRVEPRRRLSARIVAVRVVAALAVAAGLAGGTSQAQPQVVAHVRVHGVEQFSTQLSALYEALGAGADLYSQQQVLSELGRFFPAPHLEGVDRAGAFGFLWVWVDEGPLVRVPYCVLSDRQEFVRTVEAAAAAADPEATGPVLLDVPRERPRGVLLLPEAGLAEVAGEYARQQELFDTSESNADLSMLISPSRFVESRAATVRNWVGILFGLGSFGPSDEAREWARLGRFGLERAVQLASGWRQVRLELNLSAAGVTVEGSLEPVPGSEPSVWLEHTGPLPVSSLPSLLARPVALLEVGGDGGRRIGSHLPLDGDPNLSRILSMITGELCVALGRKEGGAALVLLGACENPGRFKQIVEQLRGESESSQPIISGGGPDAGWSAAQVGNWILLAFGERSQEDARAALELLHESPAPPPPATEKSSSPGSQGPMPFLRFEADMAGVGSLVATRLGLGAEESSSGSGETLRLRGWEDGGRLHVIVSMPAGSLLDCVPTLRIR